MFAYFATNFKCNSYLQTIMLSESNLFQVKRKTINVLHVSALILKNMQQAVITQASLLITQNASSLITCYHNFRQIIVESKS